MKNKGFQNLFFISSILVLSLIFFSRLNQEFIPKVEKSSPIKTTQIIKIWVGEGLKTELEKRIDKNSKFKIEETKDLKEAEYILTTDEKKIPSGFDKTDIYQRTISLKPQSFQNQFKEQVPSELKITLGALENLTPDFRQVLQQSFQKDPPEEISIVAVGDILLSRNVGKRMDEKGVKYPFLKTFQVIQAADLALANLESPFGEKGEKVREGTVFKAEPEYLEGPKSAGFDAFSLANNHFGDQGTAGMVYTFKLLKENSIYYFGAGNNFAEAHTPYLTEIKSTRIAILGYNDSDVVPASYQATPNKPGSAFMNIEQLKKDLKTAKENADFVIVSIHSGTEYTPNPNQSQQNFAKAALENGADLLIGHHPHVVQAIDYHQNKFIFYSLGNFVFDQMWSQETREGLILRLKISLNQVVEAELLPVLISDFSQPEVIKGETSEKILSRIYEASLKLK